MKFTRKPSVTVDRDAPALRRARFARFGKYSFWVWVGYQTVKGTLTTTFIWVPLIYMHFHG